MPLLDMNRRKHFGCWDLEVSGKYLLHGLQVGPTLTSSPSCTVHCAPLRARHVAVPLGNDYATKPGSHQPIEVASLGESTLKLHCDQVQAAFDGAKEDLDTVDPAEAETCKHDLIESYGRALQAKAALNACLVGRKQIENRKIGWLRGCISSYPHRLSLHRRLGSGADHQPILPRRAQPPLPRREDCPLAASSKTPQRETSSSGPPVCGVDLIKELLQPAIALLQRGKGTSLTVGRANTIESRLRRIGGQAPQYSRELCVFSDKPGVPFSLRDYSGPAVLIVGLLTAGEDTLQDVTHATPFEWGAGESRGVLGHEVRWGSLRFSEVSPINVVSQADTGTPSNPHREHQRREMRDRVKRPPRIGFK